MVYTFLSTCKVKKIRENKMSILHMIIKYDKKKYISVQL